MNVIMSFSEDLYCRQTVGTPLQFESKCNTMKFTPQELVFEYRAGLAI